MQTSRRLANEPTKLNSPRAASRRRGLSRNNLRASKEDPPRWSRRGGKVRSLGEETRRAYHRFASPFYDVVDKCPPTAFCRPGLLEHGPLLRRILTAPGVSAQETNRCRLSFYATCPSALCSA